MSTATLTWTPPTTRADGTPLAPEQIAFTDVLDGGTSIGQAMGAAGTFTTTTLTPGLHAFTVVVQDTEGRRSVPSNAASVDVPVPVVAPPAAVSDLVAALNP